VPWENEFTFIGTTDVDFKDNLDNFSVSDDEINYLCKSANQYFRSGISSNDVIKHWSGVRPLYHDGSIKEIFHSCRNRGCTICNKKGQNQWLEKQKNRLLNCGHFHLVFTLPSEYHSLWLYNRKWFINTHFKVVSETLKILLHEPTSSKDNGKKHLGATTGFISVLHTWGRKLNLHPHIHCIITAGGLTNKGVWKKCEGDYLVPIRAIKVLYRGKFQAYIKSLIQSDEINIPDTETKASLIRLHRSVFKKEWSINIQKKYDHGNGVMNYLSRYLGASPIKPQQIIEADDKKITFTYKDHRESKIKLLSLTTDEFMKRYLMHQPERRVHTVRYYGLYSHQNKEKRQYCETILGRTKEKEKKKKELSSSTVSDILCKHCGSIMLLSAVCFKKSRIKNSINKGSPTIFGNFREVIEPIIDVELILSG
jgi:hypothetical protein